MQSMLNVPAGIPPGCRLDVVLTLLSRAWTAHVVYALGRASRLHFGALRRALPGQVSARVLAARVRELEGLGIVSRQQVETGRREVLYALTDQGRALDAALRSFETALNELPALASLKA